METLSINVKRHYTELSEKETDEVVNTMAELIVNFIKRKREGGKPNEIA